MKNNKALKFFSIVAAAAMLAVSFSACSDNSDCNTTANTAVNTTVNTTAILVTTAAPETTVISTATRPVPTREKGDFSCFDNCAFVGNSRTLDLRDYGLIKNTYAFVGANVNSVYTKCAPGKNIPVMDEIGEKHYEKYFLQFGENECGWPNVDAFIKKYSRIISDIKEKDPTAKIYIQSIIPITASASLRAEDDCTNERIDIFNSRIEQLAKDENVEFIDIAVPFRGKDGSLPEEASFDGMHLNVKYSKIWLEYLAENI